MNNKDKPAPYLVEQTVEEVGKAIYEIGKLALEKANNDPEKTQYLLELTAIMHKKAKITISASRNYPKDYPTELIPIGAKMI